MAKDRKESVCVLGVDGGGTKTLAAVADTFGNVLGLGRAWSANFQGVGKAVAKEEMGKAINGSITAAGVTPDRIAAAGYGIAGADREKDYDIIAEMLSGIDPSGRYILCNDTTLALRAGTSDGVGVASVAGTGSNTMGFNAEGMHVKVGGFGGYSGDYGSSSDIFNRGVVAAMKEWDGRGRKTLLTPIICKALNLEEIADIIELTFFDNYQDPFLNRFAPLVFEAANRGDREAIRVLRTCGTLVGKDLLSCMKRLFPNRKTRVPLVLGGSIYQKAGNPSMIDALSATVKKVYPNVRVVRLIDEPCVGALLLALDEVFGKPTPKEVHERIRRTFAEKMKTLAPE